MLSSYLITALLLREREQTGALDVRAFYVRRILRIWPLYVFFILLAWTLTRIDSTEQLSARYVLAYLLLSGNWINAIAGAPHSSIMTLWSVSVEEQFYLVWPLLVKRARRQTIGLLAAGMIAMSSAMRWFYIHRGWTEGLWQNSLTRLEPMGCGILIALLLRERSWRPAPVVRGLLVAFGCAAWLTVGGFSNLNHSVAGTMLGYPVIALGSAALFLSAMGATARVLCHRAPTLYLGRISYGLYVYHMLCIRLGTVLVGRTATHTLGRFVSSWVVALACTVAMAAASYQWLERPFLRLKERFTVVESRAA